MSDQAAPEPVQSEAPVQDTGGQEQSAPDPVMARLDELAGQIGELKTPTPQEPEFDQSFSDYATQPPPGYYDQDPAQAAQQQGVDPEQQAWQQMQDMIREQVQQGVQAQVQPMMIQQQAAQLEQEFPDLKKPEVAGATVKEARRLAEQIGFANNFPAEQVDAMSRSPQLVRMAYLASRAQAMAAQETPVDGEQQVHLEGASAQHDGATEESFHDRMMKANGNGAGWY